MMNPASAYITQVPLETLVRLWKERQGLTPLRADCEITRTDGFDLDSLIAQAVQAWYYRTLTSIPLSEAPLRDISHLLTLDHTPEGGAVSPLPPGVITVASVTYTALRRNAIIITDPTHPDAVAQQNPFARAGECRPVAIVSPHSISLFPAPAQDTLKVTALTLPPDPDTFPLTPAMMAALPFDPSVINLS